MNLKNKHIHIIGIGGISMSAIACLLLKDNNKISGSDIVKSDITIKLEKLGIKIVYEHKAENVYNADIVISSASIHDDNPEIIEAKKRKIRIYTRASVLGDISKKYKNVITVSGSHGKTTTTGMISACFLNAGLEPTIHIGGTLECIKSNVYIGNNKYFIIEACEYVDSFLEFKSDSCVALNIEPDHMDYFKTLDNLINSFKKYLSNCKNTGYTIINADDEQLVKINKKKRTITYGIKNKYSICIAKNIRKCKYSKYSFDVYLKNKKLGRIKLSIPGKHEIYNALACICVCLQYKIGFETIVTALNDFSGIKRRFEHVCKINGAEVIHDYAHHPTEIEANIKTVKSSTKGRVIVIFQPHTYSRTKALLNDFVRVLSIADIAYLYKIYPAREAPIDGITSDIVSDKIRDCGTFSKSFNCFELMKDEIQNVVKKDDIILVLGAGDIENFCEILKM